MKSILLITWANIKRRKIQTLLVGICISLAALLFSTLIGIGLGMERPFENLYERLNASHIVMRFDVNVHNPEEIRNWFLQQEEVSSVSQPRMGRNFDKKLIHHGEELSIGLFFREHLGNSVEIDQLHILEGAQKEMPGPGEIWIPNHVKSSDGITVGDTLFLPTDQGLFPLLVSAIVVDAHYSNGLMSPGVSWMGPGALSLIFPVSELSVVSLGIRLKEAQLTDKVWARFYNDFGYQGTATMYAFFKQIFQIVYKITGGLLMVFAVFGIIVTFIITSSVVSSGIKTDYKMIGMLKAQGFTNRNINVIYLLQYFLITCLAVPIGIFGGHFMTQLVFKSLIAAIGTINFDISILLPSIGTFIVFLIGISSITYRTARQAGQIQPVTAIRNGGPPQKSFAGSKFTVFKLHAKSKLPFFIGLRWLMSNKKRAFLVFIGLLFVVFVQILYTNGDNSILNIDDNRPAWGYSNTDVFVAQGVNLIEDDDDMFMEDMEDDDRIKAIVKNGFYVANLPAREDVAPKTFVGRIYDDEIEKLGLVNLEGRHPVFENEMSIGVNSSADLNKGVGDTLQIFLEGQLVTYNITGVYQNLSNLSQGFKMRLEGITEINPLFKLRWYDIILKKGEDPEAFRQDLFDSYGSSYEVETGSESIQQIKGILKGIKDVLIVISLLFMGVLFVTIFNDTVLSIRENQRNIGILKAIGMTPRQLQTALMMKALIIAGLALLIGIPLSLQIIPAIMDQLVAGAGLAKFPYVFDLKNTLLNIPLILILTVISVWIASLRLLKIRPRILVRE